MAKNKKGQESVQAGPVKGDFIASPDDLPSDAEATPEALPRQEDFWRPPVRFGSIPVEKEPVGWHRRQAFYKLFPFVRLPTQVVERVEFGHPELEPNRLFWGDNLEALKALLPYYAGKVKCIYIDPPYNTGNEKWVYNDAVNSPQMRNRLGEGTAIWQRRTT